MMTFLLLVVSNNPTHGPIWFGVMADIVAIVATIVVIYEHKHRR